MWYRSLFDALLARSTRTPSRKRRAAPCARQRSRPFRPLIEFLEERTLPSTYTVNAVTDTGAGAGLTGDLRYCATHATSGSDTITFGVTGTIKLESALPVLNSSVAIQGPAANQLTVERDPAVNTSFGIFAVGSAATVEISGLTVANGTDYSSYLGAGGIANAGTLTLSNSTLSNNNGSGGGAISNSGTLTIINSILTQNYGNAGAISNSGTLTVINSILAQNDGFGGAIYSNGTLAINNSTLSGNEGEYGGAINMGGGTLSLTNSTLSNNRAQGASSYTSYSGSYPAGNGLGGGLYVGGGTVTIDQSTIAGNAAIGGNDTNGLGGPGTGYGGGIYNGPSYHGVLQMHDTIVADNSADVGSDLSGNVMSLGYNLIGSSSGGSGFASSDLLNLDPLLGPLQNNGGPTQTMALPANSPAANAGDPSDSTNPSTPAYDQRGPGYPRVFGGRIDIGAFEAQNLSGLVVSGFPEGYTAGATTGNKFTVTAHNADSSTDTSYTGTITFTSTDPTAAFFDAATGQSLLSGGSYTYTFVPGDNGTHQFTAVLTKAGTQSITATDATTAGFTGTEWNTVQPAAASKMFVNGFPSPADAGIASNLSVTLQDRYENSATSYAGTVTFSTSDAKATILNPVTGNTVALEGFTYTFTAADAGARNFSVTLNTVGPQSITVTDTANATVTASVGNIQVVPVHLVVSGYPSPTTAGAGGWLTVAAEDPSGNTVTGYTGTIVFSSSDSQAMIRNSSGNMGALSGFTYTFSGYGTATFLAQLNTAGKNQSITVTNTVTSASGSEDVEVDPEVIVSGPSWSYINQPLTFTLGTFGDPAGTVFTYQINWGDGSPLQTVTGPSGTQVTHAFSTARNWNVTVTATDPGGLTGTGSASVSTLPITVAIQTDPAHTNQQMLVITDSGYGDVIYLASAAGNSVTLETFGSIVATIAPTNSNPFALVMVLDTGTNETVDGRDLAISSVLVGGSGSELLGGTARNLLIGGTGKGLLYAGSAGDILIGGYTSYDSNTTALAYIMAEWDSRDSYSTRVSKISRGGGLNGSYVLNGTTVFDNGVTDYLYGDAGLDWFFAHTKGQSNVDKIYYRTSGETVTNI
jgi:hypothetical protein